MQQPHEMNACALTIGNKAANLVMLLPIVHRENPRLKNFTVIVPKFYPLEHATIQAHLTKNAPSWKEQWAAFKIAQGTESKHLTPDAGLQLKELRQLIQATFIKTPYQMGPLDDFLASLPADSLLMVRSSGKEDAADIANPGGNTSEPSVRLDSLSLSKAIGSVVASYFSEKSLLQRLSGQQNILEDAFMPVLIQEMIGSMADDLKDPVISGVMYTSPGGIQIQLAPGHGEYIVNSKGPFDTLFVSREGVVHTEINDKKQRLVPAESGLIYKDNPSIIAESLSVDRSIAAEIAHIGRCIQADYQMPMDVEFVYEPLSHRLSLVQARPIPPRSASLTPPSSIAPQQVLFVKKQGEVLKAQVVTPAGNSAKIITSPEELLIISNIADALETYLHHQDNRFKAVLITEKAPQTSHEAAQFNTMGLPVLLVSPILSKDIEGRLQQQHPVLIIDPQRKWLVDWTKSIKNHAKAVDELYALGIIEEGLFQSSLSIDESLLPLFYHPIPLKPMSAAMSQSLGELIEKANSADQCISEPAFNQLMQHLFDQLGTLKVDSISLDETFEALRVTKNPTYLKKIMSKLYQLAKHSKDAADIQLLYKKLFQYAIIDAAEIEKAMGNPSIGQQEWLDDVARLELLITAPFNKALQTSSIHQLLEIKASRTIASKVEGFNTLTADQQLYFISFFQLRKLIVNETLKAAWITYVLTACKKESHYQALSTLLYFLQANGITADWLNTYFDPRKSIRSMGTECAQLIQELHPLNLSAIRNQINQWEKCLNEWGNPKNFDRLYLDYIKDINHLITLDISPKTHPLTQKTIIKVVQDLTEMMDKTIKSLKGSPEYRPQRDLQVTRFYSLLKPYLRLMNHWVNKLPQSELNQPSEMIQAISQRFVALKMRQEPNQLLPSGQVTIASMTADVSYQNFRRNFIERAKSITLEDLFSLMHQNTIISTTLLGKATQIKPEQLPDLLQLIHHALTRAPYKNSSESMTMMSLINITIDYPTLHLDYNLPLRNHSAKFYLNFNLTSQAITFNAQFFGHNQGSRMDLIAKLTTIESYFLGIKTTRPAQYHAKKDLLEWTWLFDTTTIDKVSTHLHEIIQDDADITFYDSRNKKNYMNQLLLRHQDFQLNPSQPLSKNLQEFIDEFPIQSRKTTIKHLFRETQLTSFTVTEQTKLIGISENESSIQLTYMPTISNEGLFFKKLLLLVTLDNNLKQNTLELHITITGYEDPSENFKSIFIEDTLLGAELEGALLNVQVISPPHYDEKNNGITWRWRFNPCQNMTELSQHLSKSFIHYVNFRHEFHDILHQFAEIAQSPDQYEHIIHCVQDFFIQGKHRRGIIGRPDSPIKEWITLEHLQKTLPPKLLPAAIALNLFGEAKVDKQSPHVQHSLFSGPDTSEETKQDGTTALSTFKPA